jgi:hypothetical protein
MLYHSHRAQKLSVMSAQPHIVLAAPCVVARVSAAAASAIAHACAMPRASHSQQASPFTKRPPNRSSWFVPVPPHWPHGFFPVPAQTTHTARPGACACDTPSARVPARVSARVRSAARACAAHTARASACVCAEAAHSRRTCAEGISPGSLKPALPACPSGGVAAAQRAACALRGRCVA